MLGALAVAPPAGAQRYEKSEDVRAADYLPAELMRGPSWAVFDDAENDGFNNDYRVGSRFGVWQARRQTLVSSRIREIEALAELERVSKTEVFLEAVEDSVTSPLRLVKDAADRPMETLKGIPKGVARWFKRTTFKVRETYHDVSEEAGELREDVEEWREERRAEREAGDDAGTEAGEADEGQGVEETGEGHDQEEPGRWAERRQDVKEFVHDEALDYLRISSAERGWYHELGVDPYTDNLVLRRAIKSVARVEGLTYFGMRFVGLPAFPGQGELHRTMDLVWSNDPVDILQANRKRMLAAGLTKETARAFEDSALSLTQQTTFLDALDRLRGVDGRQHLFTRALRTANRDEAESLTLTAVLLAQLHRDEAPLEAVLTGAALPVTRTRSGDLVAVLVASAVFWTENVADALRSFAKIYARAPAGTRQLYVTGVTSLRFDAEVAKLGWVVVDRWLEDQLEDPVTSEASLPD